MEAPGGVEPNRDQNQLSYGEVEVTTVLPVTTNRAGAVAQAIEHPAATTPRALAMPTTARPSYAAPGSKEPGRVHWTSQGLTGRGGPRVRRPAQPLRVLSAVGPPRVRWGGSYSP